MVAKVLTVGIVLALVVLAIIAAFNWGALLTVVFAVAAVLITGVSILVSRHHKSVAVAR